MQVEFKAEGTFERVVDADLQLVVFLIDKSEQHADQALEKVSSYLLRFTCDAIVVICQTRNTQIADVNANQGVYQVRELVMPNANCFDVFKNTAGLKQYVYGYLQTLNQSPLNRLLVTQYYKQTESLKEHERLERLRHLAYQLALKSDVYWRMNPVFVLR